MLRPPTVVCRLGHPGRPDCSGHWLALTHQHLNLPQLGDGILRQRVGKQEAVLLGLPVGHGAAGRHVAMVEAGAAVILQLRLIVHRQPALGVELALVGDSPRRI